MPLPADALLGDAISRATSTSLAMRVAVDVDYTEVAETSQLT